MRVSLAIAVLCFAAAAVADYIPRKQLAGPPDEFAAHAVPDPLLGGVVSHEGSFWVKLSSASNGAPSWSTTVGVDNTEFIVMYFANNVDALALQVTDPSGAVLPLPAVQPAPYPVGDSVLVDSGNMYTFSGVQAGLYTVSLTAKAGYKVKNLTDATTYDAFLAVDSESSDLLLTHLTSYAGLLEGQTVGLRGKMFDQTQTPHVRGSNPAALRDVVATATLQAQFPDGHWETAAMHDDGLHDDGAADDGEFGGAFTAGPAGDYIVQATFEGTNAHGSFVRTSEHLVRIAPQYATLAGKAVATLNKGDNRVNAYILLGANAATDVTYRAYAQVWGVDASGAAVAVSWASALVDVENTPAGAAVKLEVDLQWLARAGASLPLTLQDVQLSEVNSLVPQAYAASIPVTVVDAHTSVALKTRIAAATARAALVTLPITREMREGVMPAKLVQQQAAIKKLQAGSNVTGGGARLVMIHGYCSSGNPWLNTKQIWPADTLYFEDLSQTRPHDDFAQRVIKFTEANGVTACAFIGHSQGGIVGAHILNSYFTCADNNPNTGRLHTSLGSPYLGCSASGGTANLGKILGGCGSNYDMTVDGATQWAATVAKDNWAKVHYYTTTYATSHCQLLMQSFLKKPNDGVTELVYAQPAAANNHGNSLNECHVTGMNYPASFLNENRNREILAAMAL